MSGETLPKQFIFNEKLDKESLFSLYTDDIVYIEEIFDTILRHFDADFNSVELSYQNGNIDDLREGYSQNKADFWLYWPAGHSIKM